MSNERNNRDRLKFWNKVGPVSRVGKGDEDFPYKAYDEWESFFKDKNVLEIGPGAGKQLNEVASLATEYSVADVADLVLKLYPEKKNRKSYKIDFDFSNSIRKKYDTIVAWYVVHHVLREEIDGFIDFLSSTLKKDGVAVFNIPDRDHGNTAADNDGTKTTDWQKLEIEDLLVARGFTVDRKRQSAGSVVLLVRIDN